MSKNAVTVKHLEIVCRCMQELMGTEKLDMTENSAIRHLEFLANNYAQFLIIKHTKPLRAKDVKLWSKEALKAKKMYPNRKTGEYLRVEHGTPRRDFARLVFERFEKDMLNEKWIDAAVITHEEDRSLNKLKGIKFISPRERWAAAGIKF